MKVYDIIVESKQLDEKPVGALKNLATKALGAVTFGDMSAGFKGSAETNDKANATYRAFRTHLGKIKTNKNQVPAEELTKWLQSQKMDTTSTPKSGILPNKAVEKAIMAAVVDTEKKAAYAGNTGAGATAGAAAGKPAAKGAGAGAGAGASTTASSTTTSTGAGAGGGGGGSTSTTTNVNVQQPQGGGQQGDGQPFQQQAGGDLPASMDKDPMDQTAPAKGPGGGQTQLDKDIIAAIGKLSKPEKASLARAIA